MFSFVLFQMLLFVVLYSSLWNLTCWSHNFYTKCSWEFDRYRNWTFFPWFINKRCCLSFMSSPVIQYTDRKQLRVERVYSDLQIQQDRVCNGKENIKRSIEAGVGNWLFSFYSLQDAAKTRCGASVQKLQTHSQQLAFSCELQLLQVA